jgi:hypothetical protein
MEYTYITTHQPMTACTMCGRAAVLAPAPVHAGYD